MVWWGVWQQPLFSLFAPGIASPRFPILDKLSQVFISLAAACCRQFLPAGQREQIVSSWEGWHDPGYLASCQEWITNSTPLPLVFYVPFHGQHLPLPGYAKVTSIVSPVYHQNKSYLLSQLACCNKIPSAIYLLNVKSWVISRKVHPCPGWPCLGCRPSGSLFSVRSATSIRYYLGSDMHGLFCNPWRCMIHGHLRLKPPMAIFQGSANLVRRPSDSWWVLLSTEVIW